MASVESSVDGLAGVASLQLCDQKLAGSHHSQAVRIGNHQITGKSMGVENTWARLGDLQTQ
jgi:hypothetical protein